MLCPKCRKNEAQELHPCPFGTDLNGDNPKDETKWCNCCEQCEKQCLADI